LGVVFGDIGTNPIDTIQTVFNPGEPHPVTASMQNVYGVVSLVQRVAGVTGKSRSSLT
jgi:KUP system potassium uptake protein